MEGNTKSTAMQTSRKPSPYSTCVCFSGLVSRSTCAAISTELLKYILIQRDQVPESFNLLFKDTQKQNNQREHRQYSELQKQTLSTKENKDECSTNAYHDNISDANRIGYTHNNPIGLNKLCTAASGSSIGNGSYEYDDSTDQDNFTRNETGILTVEPWLTTTASTSMKPSDGASSNDYYGDGDRLPFQRVSWANKTKRFDRMPRAPHLSSQLHNPAARKREQNVQTAKILFTQIDAVFQASIIPIRQIMFVLGSSPVTPKETFLLTFPSNTLEGENLSQEVVKKSFFKKLVTSDFIGSFGTPQYGCTKLFVFIHTSRGSGINWFYPNVRFAVPKRGSVYNIDLINQSIANNSLVLSNSDSSMLDISGVTPIIDSSYTETSTPDNFSKRRRLHSAHTAHEQTSDFDEFIWYQAPVVFHGFK